MPREVVSRLSHLFVEAAKSDRIRDLLKSQSVDDGPIPADASAALYREEGPIWAELAGGLGLERMWGVLAVGRFGSAKTAWPKS